MKLSRLFAELAGVRKARRLAASTLAYSVIESLLTREDYKALASAKNIAAWVTGLSGRRIAYYLYPVVSRREFTIRDIDHAVNKYVSENYMAMRDKLFASDQEIMDSFMSLYDYLNTMIAARLIERGAAPTTIYPFGYIALSGIDLSTASTLEELIDLIAGSDASEIASLMRKYGDLQRFSQVMITEFSRKYRSIRRKLGLRERRVLDAFADLSMLVNAYISGVQETAPLTNRVSWGILEEARSQSLEAALANTYYAEYAAIVRDVKKVNSTMTAYHQALALYTARLASEQLLVPTMLEPVLRASISLIAEALYARFMIELVASGLDPASLLEIIDKWWYR